jgi:hypothetical protein
MPLEITDQFKKIVDEMILACENDPELKMGFNNIDQAAQTKGTDIYIETFIVFQKHLASKKAQEWAKNRVKKE